jgi:hypothetical protein
MVLDVVQHMLYHACEDLVWLVTLPGRLTLRILRAIGLGRIIAIFSLYLLAAPLLVFALAQTTHFGAASAFAKILLAGACPLFELVHNAAILVVVHPLVGDTQFLNLCCGGREGECVRSVPLGMLAGWCVCALVLYSQARRLLCCCGRGDGGEPRDTQKRTLTTVLDDIESAAQALPGEAREHYAGQAEALLVAVRRERARTSVG